jgi:hypothetical protein
MGIEPTTYSLGSSTFSNHIKGMAAKLDRSSPKCIKGLLALCKTHRLVSVAFPSPIQNRIDIVDSGVFSRSQ